MHDSTVTVPDNTSARRTQAARVDIVVTSIGRGEFVASYADLIASAGAAEYARLIVIPDRKTPTDLYQAVSVARKQGTQVVMPTLEEQEDLLARAGIANLIPFGSDNRRNVGFLLAWMSDAAYVVSIDDDNLPAHDDMLERHAVVIEPPSHREVVDYPSGWFNPCDMLECEPDVRIFARGFPYRQRTFEEQALVGHEQATVRINAGLWRGDPDVDAVTRLALRPMVRVARDRAVVLARGTWAPVNTQNTALHRDALAAYWFVRMGHRLLGGRLDRFGDIFSGYFVQACVKHLGHSVRFGDPITHHIRNDHALLHDLTSELPGILVLEHVLEWLRECKLEGSNYGDAYYSLSCALDELAEHLDPAVRTPDVRRFLHETASSMRRWLMALSRTAP